ncbi:MAG TPA: carbohydrate-binding domain-containing protein [Myxococcota bacterium]
MAAVAVASLIVAAAACEATTSSSPSGTTDTTDTTGATGSTDDDDDDDGETDGTGVFTARDLEQEADLSAATILTLTSGNDVTIDSAGVYVVHGDVDDVTIVVAADDAALVQLVFDGVTIDNTSAPAVYVQSADKVFITTTASSNRLTVSGTFVADGDVNLDAVIFSRDDLVLNGVGTLTVESTANGISTKDDLKITGGTLDVVATLDGLEAHDSIRVGGGDITVDSGKDALHAEDDDDDTVGYVQIVAGTLHLTAAEDGIRGTPLVQIDGGTIVIEAAEGIEATLVQFNDGDVTVDASDDGINASDKSTAYDVRIEVNGGTIAVTVGSGDTDAFDANGDIFIGGGTIDVVTPRSAFDADGTITFVGGTVTVNGEQVTEIAQESGPGGGGGGGPP